MELKIMNSKKVFITASLMGCVLNQNHAQRLRDYSLAI